MVFKACAIVLNWNGWKNTIGCLESLFRAEPPPDTVIVCDNGSTDKSWDRILKWFEGYPSRTKNGDKSSENLTSHSNPSFLLIQNPANLGFSAGNNPGIRWALAQDRFHFIWLLNNDTRVHPKALALLCELAERDPKAGVIGSTIVKAEEKGKLECAGGCWYEPITTIVHRALYNEPLNSVLKAPPTLKLDYIYGVSMFVRKEVFETVGLLNDEYFLFYEELDLCKRAQCSGFRLAWAPESIVYHQGGASVGSSIGRIGLSDRRKVAFANYHENLSTLLFTKNFYPHLLPLTMFCRFLGKLAAVVRRREVYLVKSLLKAYLDFGKRLLEPESARG